ncbi:MAG: helix-turn-helix domain-containing protein [Myxococcales bacterium]|nr:helix-turn-helix domain-containing protein [Myxococcales bacterium]
MRIDILVPNLVFDSGLATLLDCFMLATGLAAQATDGGPPLEVRRVGLRPEVHTAHGLRVPIDATVEADSPPPDVAIMPALGCITPATLDAALRLDEVRETAALLARWRDAGTRIGGACTGTFVMAAAGLLDEQPATTTWWLAPDFRRRYPRVQLDTDRMVVPAEGCVTAGAALAHVDLALWLIRQQSPHLARVTARYLLLDERPSQATFAMADHLVHDDDLVTAFEAWTREHLCDFSIAEAAIAIGTSQRTLQRRVHKVLGRSPIAYAQDVRAEQAVHLLRTTEDTLEAIAEAVGYTDPVTLRALLRRRTGLGIRAIRRGPAGQASGTEKPEESN